VRPTTGTVVGATVACFAVILAAPAVTSGARGKLDCRQVLDNSRATYTEGSVSYVRVRDRGGRLVVRRAVRQRPRFRLRRRLPAGLYRVRSFQRPCAGNCDILDPPIDSCARRFRVLPRGLTVVRATVRPGSGCTLAAEAHPALFPPRERVRAVRRFLRSRAALNSWALIDSRQRLHGFAPNRTYASASVIKAMLLVAYLRRIGNRLPNASERGLLGPMITASDNARATAIYHQVGDAALRGLARRAGMSSFSVTFSWGYARFSATDQARFFAVVDTLAPPRSRGYARRLLSSIVPAQRWGFSRFALARGFRTFFKGGWRGTGLGRIVHEAALFQRGPLRFSMAVLTDANPTHEFGTATLRGVAARIFR
jgi:hypothetical protein